MGNTVIEATMTKETERWNMVAGMLKHVCENESRYMKGAAKRNTANE